MAKEAENKAVSSPGGAGPKESSGAPENEAGDSAKAAAKGPDTVEGQDAVALLKADHRKVESLFQQYETARNSAAKQRLVDQIAREFLTHSRIEEEIFYPACREKIDDDLLDEAQVEHDSAKLLLRELCEGSPGDPYYDAKVTVLSEYVKHHVGEEEKGGSGIFEAARKAGVDLTALGKEISDRKEEIMQRVDEERQPAMPSLNGGKGNNRKEYAMAQQDYMDRDRRGSRYDDDDDYRGRRMPPRDEEGRFMSDDRRSRSSRDYDDDDRGRGRGHGGWFGDPEGHSEASRLGWEHRDSGRSSRYDDDDRSRRSSSSRLDDYTRDRYDDDRRGSSARGRGRDEDRGQGGWFGDPEGHSEASRRGWEHREGGYRTSGRYEDDDRGGRYSRGRDDDDDGRGRGRGGWFGDPRGHSEAARRGWQNR